MQAELLHKEAVTAKVRVSVTPEEVNQMYRTVLREIIGQMKVPGFRPGKVPVQMARTRFGEEALKEQVRERMVNAYFVKALQQLELNTVKQVLEAEMPQENESYSFEADLELYPEVTLPNLQDIVIDTPVQHVSEAMLQEAIDNMRSQHAVFLPVERAVQAGDYLNLEMLAKEDEDVAAQEGENTTMPLDLERASEELIQQLLGKNIEEVVDLYVTDPNAAATDAATDADSSADAKANTMHYRVRIKDIREKDKPEADDDFAKTLNFDSWSEVEAQIRQQLQQTLDRETASAQRNEVLEKLMAETEIVLPESLVTAEIERLRLDTDRDLQQQGMSLEGYLDSLDETARSAFQQELEQAAHKRAESTVLLNKIVEVRKVQVSEQELGMVFSQIAQQQGQDLQAFAKNLSREEIHGLYMSVARQKALSTLIEELTASPEGEAAEEVSSSDDAHAAAENDAAQAETEVQVE